jgi:peptide/nickel transport system substrate-binding protein
MTDRSRFSRRALLQRSSAGLLALGATGLLAACQAPAPASAPQTVAPPAVTAPAVTAPAVAAPAKPTQAPASSVPSRSAKGTLTVGLSGQSFQTMDQIRQGVTEASSIYDALYDRLVFVDTLSGGKLNPGLATAWKQVDPVTWDFSLRQGVTFHNGEPFDANSAAFSLHLVLDDPKNWLQARIGGIARTEAPDPGTLRVVTKTPDVLTIGNIGEIPMYPRAYYQSAGPDGFAKQPVGTGQWKFDSWADGVTITLTKYDGYWADKAKFDRLVYRPIPEAATRTSALLAGEIDLAYNVNIDDERILASKGLKAVAAPVGQGTGVNLLYLGGQARDNPMSDTRVRQALNYAVDKDAIANDILLGSTRVLKGQIVGPDCFGFNSTLAPYPYDPQKAKQLLSDAGYPNGFSIDFQSSAANYAKAQEVSQNVVAQLAKVGVNAKLQMLEWNLYLDKLINATSAPMFYVGWNYYPVMDANFAIQHFLTKSQFKLFANPRLDQLYDEESNEFDRAKREGILQQFMAVMREEAPMLFLFQSPLLYGINPRVQGFQSTANDRPQVKGLSLAE